MAFVIPLLALGSVGLILLYAVVVLRGFGGYYVIEWLAAMLLLVFCARAVLADYPPLTRRFFWLVFAVGAPLAIIYAGVSMRSLPLTLHAFVLFIFCTIGWTLLEPLVSQCTGHTGQAPKRRRKVVFIPYAPFLMTVETDEPGGLAFSGDALMSLFIAGVVVFSLGDFLRRSQGYPILTPMPFALAFFVMAGALTSLSKLVQRVQQTPGSIRLEPGFARAWGGAMLAVLIVSGLIAYAMPKRPVVGTGQWVVAKAQDQAQPYKIRWRLPGAPPPDQPASTATAPLGGRGQVNAPAAGAVPGATPAAAASDGPVTDRTLDVLYQAATAFEDTSGKTKATAPGSGGDNTGGSEGKSSAGSGASGQGSGGTRAGTGQSGSRNTGKDGSGRSAASGEGQARPADAPPAGAAAPPPAPNPKLEQLKEALRNRPDRLVKLLVAALLALAALAAVLLLLIVAVRRHIWAMVANLARAIWEWLGATARRRLAPIWGRLARQRRERRIRQLMEAIHPFEDPFAQAGERASAEVARDVYQIFLGYAWLLGYERKPSETDFLFASRLGDASGLDDRAIQEISMGCVRAAYSPMPLTSAELAQLQQSLATITAQVTARLPDETRAERMDAYRRLLAERQLDRDAQLPEAPADGDEGLVPAI